MRVIPTQVHGVIDYLGGILLLLAPNLLGFADVESAATIARIMGAATLHIAALTRYELGLAKVIPMSTHLIIDVVTSLFLAASPFIFGFSDEPANVWLPHVVVGIGYLIVAVLTETTPRNQPTRATE